MRWVAAASFALTAVWLQRPSVRLPIVTGPIPAAAAPGDPSHDYPFGASHIDLAKYGYREDEFFIEGAAAVYSLDGETTATVSPDEQYPYKTRVIIRRPTAPAKFNGTVILEWINGPAPPEAGSRSEQQNDWLWSYDHLMRAGYGYAGFSGYATSVELGRGLKNWNPTRYGTLSLSGGGKYPGSRLSYDILSQLVQALRQRSGSPLAGGLKVRNVIATGHSGSALRLIDYYNSIQPLTGGVDGFVFHGGARRVRTDIRTPAWKLLAETDLVGARAERQADTEFLRTWEVAGAAHADWDLVRILEALFERDEQRAGQTECDRPRLSRVRAHFVQDAVYDWMKQLIETRTQPPHAPPIELSTPAAGGRGIARDANGIALGGIRLADVAVPVATDSGENSGGPYCGIMGSHVPFDEAKLARLYPTHAAYVAAVERATNANLKAGYITRDGAAEIKRDAARSKVPRN